MIEQDQGVFPIPVENLPEYGTYVRIQGLRSVLVADRDGQPMPFIRHNEQLVVKFTPHIKQLLEQGWADLIDFIEQPAASQYFPTMDDVLRLIDQRAHTLPGEAILGAKVDGDDLILTVGLEDGSVIREVRVTLPQLVDMTAQIGRAEDAADRAEFAQEQIMQLVQDAAQAAADAVTSDAEKYSALAGAAAERAISAAEDAKKTVESIGVIQGPMGPVGPMGPPGGGASDVWQAEPAEVIDLLPNLAEGWSATQITVQRVGGWVAVTVQALKPKATWGNPVGTGGMLPERLRPQWAAWDVLFSETGNDGARISMTTGGRLYLDSLTTGGLYSGTLVYPLPSGAPVPLVKGPQGEKGNPGPQGPRGVKGDQGDPGRDGASVSYEGIVATYANLPTGLTSADKGKGWVVTADGRIYVWDGTAFPQDGQAPEFRGPKGETGDKGDTGPQGKQGVTGATGPKGATGATGEKGATGDTGPKGPKGDRGDPGSQGQQGSTGLPGKDGRGLIIRGTVSTTASLPSSATTGDGYVISSSGRAVQWNGTAWSEEFAWTGPQGPQGLQGLRGEQGATGQQGPKGDRGDTGRLDSTQTAELFGSSSYTKKPAGILRWSGPWYNPPTGFMRLKYSSDGRLRVHTAENGGAVASSDTACYLYAPVTGTYLLSACQCWGTDTGARGTGLTTNINDATAGVALWVDIGIGRMATGTKVCHLTAGTRLYPWTFSDNGSSGMAPDARGQLSEFSITLLRGA